MPRACTYEKETNAYSVQTSELLAERLQAWKHAVGYLEAYVGATEKIQKAHAKEYEKVLKVWTSRLR